MANFKIDAASAVRQAATQYGLVMVSTGIMKLEKRVVRDTLNSKLKIKR